MKMTSCNPTRIILAVTCALAAIPAQADESLTSGLTLTPSIGYHGHSSNKQGLEDSPTLSFGAGYQFSNPWAIELTYLKSEPEFTNSSNNLDEEQVRLDALYFFNRDKAITPYAVFGAGESNLQLNNQANKNSIINAGLGVKYAFNDIVSLRSDLRAVNYLDTETTQAAFNLGVSLLLGNKSQPGAPKIIDTDNDGVADNIDSCPNTKGSIPVDSTGCPINLDQDKDGINDSQDQCPDTEAGAKVDDKGCYRILNEERVITLRLQFDNNATDVVNPNDPQLISLSKFLKEFPQTDITLFGYTDSSGSESYNLMLSQQRAAAVSAVLTKSYGINIDRISTQGFGEANPVADNNTVSGRAKNRRVEATVKTTVNTIEK